MDTILNLLIFGFCIGGGYFFGSWIEKQHYRSIRDREKSFLRLPAVTSKNLLEDRPVEKSIMVYGSVSLAIDAFKMLLSGLRSILGGRLSSTESILDRARREAILRLKEQAPDSDIILNLRLETIFLEKNSVEVFACGTAVYYKK